MWIRGFLTLGLVMLSAGAIFALRPAAEDRCTQMIAMIAEKLRDLPVTACTYHDDRQTKVVVDLRVPATRVLEVQEILITTYDMKPLDFVCCGFETQAVTLFLPEDHPLKGGTPQGAYRDITISYYVDAFVSGSEDIQHLGTIAGVLTLQLVDT